MGIVGIPKTWATDDVLTAADLNTLNSTLYNEFNGNIDNNNIKNGANIDGAKFLNSSITGIKLADSIITDSKLDYTSAKVMRVGPNFAGSNGRRMACGGKAFTYAAGVATITITFSTDSDDGNPAFAAAPRFVGTTEVAGGAATHTWRIIAKLASSVTLELKSSNAGDTSSGTFHWIATSTI